MPKDSDISENLTARVLPVTMAQVGRMKASARRDLEHGLLELAYDSAEAKWALADEQAPETN